MPRKIKKAKAKRKVKKATSRKTRPARKGEKVRRRQPARRTAKPVAAKPAAKKSAAAKPAKSVATKPVAARTQRRAELDRLRREEHALERDAESDVSPNALRESPEYVPGALQDDLAEEMGEAFVDSAGFRNSADEDIRDEELDEEKGGPFVPSTARREFARGTDASNPKDAEPADFPTSSRRQR